MDEVERKYISRGKPARWDERWIRFRMALKQMGVEPRFGEYYRAWVLGFLGFIKPRRYEEVKTDEVREFLRKMAGDGKKEWQLRQAEEGLRVFFQDVEPQKWAEDWPRDLLAEVKLDIGILDGRLPMWEEDRVRDGRRRVLRVGGTPGICRKGIGRSSKRRRRRCGWRGIRIARSNRIWTGCGGF